jgi:hypothetical protein
MRFCGPSDDPDEQTNVIESYRYLLILPPIFGAKTFQEVVASSSKSLKDNLEHLDNGLRKLADLYAHQTIKPKEQYPTKNQVEPFRPQFELLIQELLNRTDG